MTRSIRQIRIEGNIAYVPLTQGYEAIIDAEDVPMIIGRNWSAVVARRSNGLIRAVYAYRVDTCKGKQKTIRLHRLINDTPFGMETDHVDGDGLNNRRENLRTATHSQNQHNQRIAAHNTSGVKGVSWDKSTQKWQALIKLMGKRKHLGLFATIDEASAAYAKESAALRGSFGRTA